MTGLSSRLVRLARWRYLRWALAIPALPLALWACNARDLQEPNPLPEQQNDQFFEVNPVRDIDILFAIDNSPSMAEEQDSLTKNFPTMMKELQAIPGGLPNVHIAVVSSDMGAGPLVPGLSANCARPGGDRGLFLPKPNCGLDASSRWLVSRNAGTMNNFTGDISMVFSCLALIGTNGCGYEHQLQAARVALSDFNPENKGFLRPDAYLALIFLTDEDDCSAPPDTMLFAEQRDGQAASLRCATEGHVCGGMHPPGNMMFQAPLSSCKAADDGKLYKIQEFVDYFRSLKKRPESQILVASVHGWPNNETGAQYLVGKGSTAADAQWDYMAACDVPMQGKATPAIRMKAFADSFGANGSSYNLCTGDLRGPMQQIGKKLAVLLGTTCVSAPIVDKDGDASNGVQADCQVIDERPMGSGYQQAPLPACAGGGQPPCWKLEADPTCSASGFKMITDRGGEMPPPGTRQSIRCLTCARPDDPRCKH